MKVPQDILEIAHQQLQSAKEDVSYYEGQIDNYKKKIKDHEQALQKKKQFVEEYQLFLDEINFEHKSTEEEKREYHEEFINPVGLDLPESVLNIERNKRIAGIKEND